MIRKAVIGNGSQGLLGQVGSHGKWLWILSLVVLAMLSAMLAGCTSATKTVQRELSATQALVSLAREEVQNARTKTERIQRGNETPEPVKVALTPVVAHLDAAEGHIDAIGESVSKAQAVVPDLEDRGNWLTDLFGEAGTIIKLVIGTVLVVALAFLGLWAIRRFGYLLPRAKRDEATLARAVLADDDPTTAREYIAARRAADAQLNIAMASSRPPPE